MPYQLPVSSAVSSVPPQEFGIIACTIRYWAQALDFHGRATRRDFLVATLMNVLITVVLAVIDPLLAKIYGVVTIVPNLSQLFRRCHDSGRPALIFPISVLILWGAMYVSGPLFFLPALALVGLTLWLAWVAWIVPGDPFTNAFGADPRA